MTIYLKSIANNVPKIYILFLGFIILLVGGRRYRSATVALEKYIHLWEKEHSPIVEKKATKKDPEILYLVRALLRLLCASRIRRYIIASLYSEVNVQPPTFHQSYQLHRAWVIPRRVCGSYKSIHVAKIIYKSRKKLEKLLQTKS